MHNKKNVLFFDLGGVLLNFSHEKMFENVANYSGLSLDLIKRILSIKNWGNQYESGHIDTYFLCNTLSGYCGKSLDIEKFKTALSEIFSLNTEMPPLLHSLKNQGARLYLLSNTCEAHFEYVQKHFDFLNVFDGFVLSYEVGARKPAKKIYHAALQKTGVSKEECAYIDDVSEYAAAAQKLGIDSHVFEGVKSLIPSLNKWGFSL